MARDDAAARIGAARLQATCSRRCSSPQTWPVMLCRMRSRGRRQACFYDHILCKLAGSARCCLTVEQDALTDPPLSAVRLEHLA